jgi:hypothetical protein
MMILNTITKTHIGCMPDFCERYMNLVEENNLDKAFKNSIRDLWNLDINKLTQLHSKRYAPGKWTVNDILQHLSDTERIVCAGILRFARGEKEYVISFNEEIFAANANADNKPVERIIEELITVRKATYGLYSTFDGDDFFKTGIDRKRRLSIAAMGFNMLGHQVHHLNSISDKYYSLI